MELHKQATDLVTTSWGCKCRVISSYILKSCVTGSIIVERGGNSENITMNNEVTSNEILYGMSAINEFRESERCFNFLEPEKLLKCQAEVVGGVIERPDSDHHRSSSELFGTLRSIWTIFVLSRN